MVRSDEIKTFTYEGDNNMIDFESDTIPKVNPKFKATLKLKNGKEVVASKTWRKKIWVWWYENRKDEILTNCLINMSNQLLGRRPKDI